MEDKVGFGTALKNMFVGIAKPEAYIRNGEKGKAGWMKWFFYIYYPLHLVIIGILRLVMYGNVSLLF